MYRIFTGKINNAGSAAVKGYSRIKYQKGKATSAVKADCGLFFSLN
jgi:hypothetical protein